MSDYKSVAKSRVKPKVHILFVDSLSITLYILEVEWLSVSTLLSLDFLSLDGSA